MNMILTPEQQNILHTLIKSNQVIWRLYSRAFKRYILLMIAIGTTLILYGICTPYTFSTEITGGKSYYNLNLSVSIGLAFLLVALIYFRHMLRNRRVFFEITDKHVGDHSLDPKDFLIEITPDTIKIANFNAKHEYRWKYFSHFKLKGEILFLLTDNSYLNAVAVPRSLTDLNKFNELLNWAKHHLIEKK